MNALTHITMSGKTVQEVADHSVATSIVSNFFEILGDYARERAAIWR